MSELRYCNSRTVVDQNTTMVVYSPKIRSRHPLARQFLRDSRATFLGNDGIVGELRSDFRFTTST